MPRLTQTLLAAVAALALASSSAYAAQERGPVGTSSLAGTTSPAPVVDLRGESAREPGTAPAGAVKVDLRGDGAREPGATAAAVTGAPRATTLPVADDDGDFPLVPILAVIGAGLLVGATMVVAMRQPGRTARA